MKLLGIFTIAAFVSFAVTPAVRRLALALGIMDQPNRRKVHRQPLPRLGGLAIYLAWGLALGLMSWLSFDPLMASRLFSIVGLGAVTVLFGFWDDWKDLSGKFKLLAQVGIASLIFVVGFQVDRLSNPFGGELLFPGWLSYLVTVLWVIGMMNAMNLIDGLDGLAAGIAMIAALGLAAVSAYAESPVSVIMLAALAGSCAGFLVHNFPPAKIFLGDTGSQFLGFVFAVASLVDYQYKSATAVALLIPLTALTLPIYDTALAVVRRLRGHRSLFRADKYHLHHRLLRMGLTQRQVVLLFYGACVYLSILAFLFVVIPEAYALLLLIMLAMGLTLVAQALRFIELRLRLRYRRRRRLRAA